MFYNFQELKLNLAAGTTYDSIRDLCKLKSSIISNEGDKILIFKVCGFVRQIYFWVSIVKCSKILHGSKIHDNHGEYESDDV